MKAFFLKIARTAARAGLADLFLFGGMGLLGYGLWLFSPALSFTVCGGILMALGLLLGRGRGPAG